MRLENKICSLELAKKLEELGVKQESLFYWAEDLRGRIRVVGKDNLEIERSISPLYYKRSWSAYTVAELSEMLPYGTKISVDITTEGMTSYEIIKKNPLRIGEWWEFEHLIQNKNLADSLADTIIYILENNLVSVEDINSRIKEN